MQCPSNCPSLKRQFAHVILMPCQKPLYFFYVVFCELSSGVVQYDSCYSSSPLLQQCFSLSLLSTDTLEANNFSHRLCVFNLNLDKFSPCRAILSAKKKKVSNNQNASTFLWESKCFRYRNHKNRIRVLLQLTRSGNSKCIYICYNDHCLLY